MKNNIYKILILKNRLDVDIMDDCNKSIEYFKKHKINISFDFKESNLPIKLKEYAKATNGQVYAGFEDSIKDSCYDLVPKGEYHVCMVAWNTKENTTNLIPTSWTNWSPLDWRKADTEFVQLITNDYNDKTDWIYNSITHELVHTFCKRLGRRGLNVLDEMDISNGIPYLHNENPEHSDGNFARTLKNIEQHKDKLYDFYFISKEQPMNKYKYFKDKEIVGLKPELVQILDQAREISGTPYIIASGLRSPEVNKASGGVSNSSHLTGEAVDLQCTDNIKRTKILKGLLAFSDKLFIEICGRHIHVDIKASIHPLGSTMWGNDPT